MRKLIVTCTIVGLLAGALVAPAEAGKKKRKKKPKRIERVAEGTYDNPAIGIPGVVGTSSAGGAVEFGLAAKEKFVSVEIEDASGQPVMATMSQEQDDSTPAWNIIATFCGETEEAVEVLPGVPIRVSVYTIPGPDYPTCTGPASSGTITGTFSNLP